MARPEGFRSGGRRPLRVERGQRRSRSVRGARRRGRRLRGRRIRSPTEGAQTRLRGFRQATIVAVAVTGFLLLVFAPEEAGVAQDAADTAAAAQVEEIPDSVAIIRQVPVEALQLDTAEEEVRPDTLARAATEEAARTIRDLWNGFLANLPKFLVALAALVIAGILTRLLRPLLHRLLGRWERGAAAAAMVGVVIWLLAIGIAVSVIAGDIRALLGSLGLVGLALSWALQTPIESFTGWLLNSFQGYYRVGDRIAVGEVFGDVYHIDFLTTTVWEYGGPDHPPGSIQAEQPTGRLITFPNNEVLTGSVINYTRDFPFVWDELTVAIANESEIRYAVEALERVARDLLGDHMAEPARQYEAILQRVRLESSIPDVPEVYVSATDWGTSLTVRYLVGAREKRRWKSELSTRVLEELNRPEHAGRILPVYPRQQIQLVQPDGTVAGVRGEGGEREG